jgi:hypothetical protein
MTTKNIRQPTKTPTIFRFQDGRAESSTGGQLRRTAVSQNMPSAANSADAPVAQKASSLNQSILERNSQAPQIATTIAALR